MSNQLEKQLFSQRLKQALHKANYPISPTHLSNEFNYRYDGSPISVQSANNWLLGKAIPNQDKLLILATWLDVSNQWLRFGDTESVATTSNLNLTQIEVEYLRKYQNLKAHQKAIIQNLIDEFITH